MSEQEKVVVTGEQNPGPSKNNEMLQKEDIMFKVDGDGNAIPEKVSVEIYDKALDDEIFYTTIELDNAISMHESIAKASKQVAESDKKEMDKLEKRISELEVLKERTPEQNKLLIKSVSELREKIIIRKRIDVESLTKIQAFVDKIKESRKDLQDLEKIRKDQTVIKKIEAVPCRVFEAYKYLTKKMWKDESGKWVDPSDLEDTSYISHMLADKVTNPKLTVTEWDNAKPSVRLAMNDTIASISEYKKPSPKEILIERRRNEQLKNILGEC